jgi:hypothetical protein
VKEKGLDAAFSGFATVVSTDSPGAALAEGPLRTKIVPALRREALANNAGSTLKTSLNRLLMIVEVCEGGC